MKKSSKVFLVIAIITTVLASITFIISTIFFNMYFEGIAAGKKGEQFGGMLAFIIFNFFSLAASLLNFIPCLIHLIKCHKPYVIVMFIFSCLLLLSASGMLGYLHITSR